MKKIVLLALCLALCVSVGMCETLHIDLDSASREELTEARTQIDARISELARLEVAETMGVPAVYTYVYDYTAQQMLSAYAIGEMEQHGSRIEAELGVRIVALAIDSMEGIPVEDYAAGIMAAWGIASGDEGMGVLVLFSVADGVISVTPGAGLSELLGGDVCRQLTALSEQFFTDEEYGEGLCSLYASVCACLADAMEM